MFLSNASIRRPVAMCCLLIALTLLGLNSWRKMGVELLPRMDVPYVTVVTVYPGASPADIEVDVAGRIEDAVSSVDGVKHMTSLCMENAAQTFIEFELGVDVNVAASDVREKIDQELSKFPAGVEKPIVLKFNLNASPVATMALSGDAPLDELYDYADDSIRDRLSVVYGVANVELIGGSEREVQVLLDRGALSAAGLTTMHVVRALQQGVSTMPAGRLRDSGSEYAVRFDAEYDSVRDIANLQVAGAGGARRYLGDLGSVVMGAQERRQAALIDGSPCIGIRVVKKADANAVKVVEAVRAEMERLRPGLPGGMDLAWVTDSGAFIKASVDSTTSNIFAGIILTACILFAFLFNVRSTFVVAITMPVTVIISIFFVQLMGFTLNISTLLGAGLSVGVIVTNSIVVLESILGHFNRSGDAWAAARDGASEVGVAVIASAGTNVVVLLPIGLMGSMIGLFFRPFAITAFLVNAVSLFISFTLTPILCAVLLRKSAGAGFFARAERRVSAMLDRAAGGYASFLRRIARRRATCALALAAPVLLLVVSLRVGAGIGFSFMPDMDRGEATVKLEYPTRQGLAETVARVRQVEETLRAIPGVRHTYANVGKVESILGQSSEGVYLAQVTVMFPGKTERSESIHSIVADLRRRMSAYPGAIVTVGIPDVVAGQKMPVEIEIAGDDIPELERTALRVRDAARAVPGILEPDALVREGKPELSIVPARAILADMGAAPSDMALMMRANLEGLTAATFRSGSRTYDVRVKLAEREGKRQVAEFEVPVTPERSLILSGLAGVEERKSPVQITRVDKRRVIKLFANLSPDLALGAAVERVTAAVDAAHILPAGYSLAFRGDYERMEESVIAFAEAGILAVLLTYLTLAAVLESFTRPFLIMTTVPLGLIGIIWALYLTGTNADMFALLGGVMLIGIVVNMAVLILDHMQALVTKGVDRREAMLHAVSGEFRAVLMITLAAVLGMLPFALSSGLGGELYVGIGVASVGGILISAILALLVIPLLHLLLAKRKM